MVGWPQGAGGKLCECHHVKATAASRLPERDALLLPSDTLCCKEGVQQASEPGQCLLKCANPPTERESLDMRASVPGHV